MNSHDQTKQRIFSSLMKAYRGWKIYFSFGIWFFICLAKWQKQLNCKFFIRFVPFLWITCWFFICLEQWQKQLNCKFFIRFIPFLLITCWFFICFAQWQKQLNFFIRFIPFLWITCSFHIPKQCILIQKTICINCSYNNNFFFYISQLS